MALAFICLISVKTSGLISFTVATKPTPFMVKFLASFSSEKSGTLPTVLLQIKLQKAIAATSKTKKTALNLLSILLFNPFI